MKKVISMLLILGMLFQGVVPVYAQQEVEKISIAIMDFQNTSGNSDLDYLQKAIPEALITRLAQSGKLNIVERARLEDALKELQLGLTGVIDQSAAVEIGKAVGANAIMVGSFVEISGLIRINARLIDVKTSKVLKAEVVQGRVGTEIFDLMDNLAAEIEKELVGAKKPEKVPPQKPISEVTTQPQAKPIPKPITPAPTKKGGSKAGLYILGGALLIGGGVAAALLLSKKKEEEKKPTTTSIEIVVPLQ